MAAIEEFWEPCHVAARLLSYEDQEDALDFSPFEPDNGSSLSEEDYVDMFTELHSDEDFFALDFAEETEDITYVDEQDVVTALDSALNSALASYNIPHSSEVFCSSSIGTIDITQTWESYTEDVAVEEEIAKLESDIQDLEKELALTRARRCTIQSNIVTSHSCLYSSFSFAPKRKLEDTEFPIATDDSYFAHQEEEEAEYDSESSSDEDDSDDDSSSSDDESSDSSSDSSDSSDSSSESESESSDSSSEDEISSKAQRYKRTIYIPYKRRKTQKHINRIKLIKTDEEEENEEDVDILN